MITSFVLFLLIVAVWLALFDRMKISVTVLIIAIFSFILIGNGLLPAYLLNKLQLSFINLPTPEWKKQNAIIVLGAGTLKIPHTEIINPSIMAHSRINKAAELYLACVKTGNQCTIIISGGDALHSGKSEAEVYQNTLARLGINTAAIILEPQSMNTYKNAELTSAILKKHQFDQIILVTSGIHLQRALLYFSHFGVRALPVLADYLPPQVGIIPLGYNFAMTDFAIHEYMGIARFHLYNLLGLNVAVSSQGAP